MVSSPLYALYLSDKHHRVFQHFSDGSVRNILKSVSLAPRTYYRPLIFSAVYPVVEEEETKMTGEDDEDIIVPMNMASANPNGVEFDNLYLDMNGIVRLFYTLYSCL